MLQLRPFAPILISTAFFMFSHGLYSLLVPIRAQIEGFSPTAIGTIATGYAIGFTAGCFLVPFSVRKVGHIRAFGALAATLSTLVLLSAIVVHPIMWFLVRAAMGVGVAGSYMILESWLNERTTNANRGSVFSIYMIITQLALMAGQFTLPLADPQTSLLFMATAMAFTLAVLPTALTGVQSPAPLSHVSINFRKLYVNSQIAVVGSFLAGIIGGAWTSFAPVFGDQVGLSNGDIALMMGLAMAGGMVFQYPIGKASDLVDRRYVMVACGIAGAILGTALYAVATTGGGGSVLFFALMFLFGSVLFTIYSLFVAHANDFADAADFVETASGLLVVYGVGTMVGPLATAALLEGIGPSGMFAVTSLGHVGIAVFALWRVTRNALPDDFDSADFQSIGMARTNTPQTYEFDPRADETDESS
ncbi:MAG: MFS transporter [Pseudomonadota bacterium]